MDTFTTLWNRLQSRCPAAGPALSQQLIQDSFNQLAERRQWSWLMKPGAFFPANLYQTGTVDVTPGLFTVSGTGTAWTVAMVGIQIRIGGIGSSYPTYTITQVLSPTSLVMDQPWTGPTLTGQQYQIFQCYFNVPSDFNYFYSLINPTNNYRLWTNCTEADFDRCDAQRANSGPSFGAAFYGYTATYLGTIDPVLQVRGSGAVPVSTTGSGYSFPANGTFTVEITTSGASGAATFQWKFGSGAYTTAVTTDVNPIDLAYGVQVYFPVGTYVIGDTFIINVTAGVLSGVPRYELWPRPIATPYVYPFLYVARHDDLSDTNPVLPEFIARRGDVVLEMALACCARFPGTDHDHPNIYYDLSLADRHQTAADKMVNELETQDDNVGMKNLTWANSMEYAPSPWLDGSYLQSHAWPYAGW